MKFAYSMQTRFNNAHDAATKTRLAERAQMLFQGTPKQLQKYSRVVHLDNVDLNARFVISYDCSRSAAPLNQMEVNLHLHRDITAIRIPT